MAGITDTNPFSVSDPRYNTWAANPDSHGDLLAELNGAQAPSDNGEKQTWGDHLFPNSIANSDLADVGRLGVGIYGATQPLPVYSKPHNWTDYVRRLEQMSHQGFTPEESSLANSNATNAYASDISNINNADGGNGAVALGNYGRAANNLYRQKAQLAAQDAALHRSNLLSYGGAVGQDANMDRQIFMDKLNQETENKRSGAALMSSALQSLSNRGQYNKQYGAGSPYQKWVQAQVDAENASTASKEASTKNFINGLNTPSPNNSIIDATNPANGVDVDTLPLDPNYRQLWQ